MIYANSLDPDEATQNMGPDLGSKVFEFQILKSVKVFRRKLWFFSIFERNKIRENWLGIYKL